MQRGNERDTEDFTLTGLEVDRSIKPLLLHGVLSWQRHPGEMYNFVSVERRANVSIFVNSKWWNAMGMWHFYQCAIEVARSFVPGLGVTIFTHTYVIHKSIAVDKAFPWKILKKDMWSSNIYGINKHKTRPTQFIFIPLGKGVLCACSLIFTTSKGVTEKRKTTDHVYVWQHVHCTNVA